MSIFVEGTTGAKLLIGRGSFGYTVEAAASAPLDPVRASPGSSPHSHKIVCIKSVLAELHVDGKPYVRQSLRIPRVGSLIHITGNRLHLPHSRDPYVKRQKCASCFLQVADACKTTY